MNLEECKYMCLKNCSCTAYSNLDIRDGGSGCLLWFGDLVVTRVFSQNEQDIYIRMAASELGNGDGAKVNDKSNTKKTIILSSVLSTGTLLLCLAMVLYIRNRKQRRNRKVSGGFERNSNSNLRKENLDLPLFDLYTLAGATMDFSEDSKLGEGGFGPVYKGTLKDGREIAVKRLSKFSRQGFDEFTNVVKHIVELQHRNLVKLLGCCIERDEKMLVYEFLSNKSLDFFIFG
ncbi:hypothetical protein POPTR_011G126251v4 [Populus trichocarpa]|uniref:Uncharacterized protein n=1 Tax=Populus trichocarpa TaxID=3694 RepID=A0ACC0S959_POPTR|nr:hypothetical protein BDE02_11G112200 [Populus trichocarpa]KAI9385924.1 hypothetical protein POPTR_011G126251v4 [Populus trichocarpa]